MISIPIYLKQLTGINITNMPKIILIGSGLSGMIGSRFTEMFAADFDFINLDLTNHVDITDQAQLDRVFRRHPATVVIHLAAFTDVSKAYEQRGDKNGLVYKVNVLGTQNIANACHKFHHYLVHISTDFIFDGKKQEPYTEIDQPCPIEWYGQTKLLAEQAVKNSGCQFIIARLAFPFRSHFSLKQDLVRNILEKLKTNSLPPMLTDQIITPTFIDDICSALKVFIEKKPQGIFHLVGNTSLTPYDLAKKVAGVFQLQSEIQAISIQDFLKNDPRPRQQYLKISNAKLKKYLGIDMKTIDEALLVLKDQLAVV